MSTRARVLSLLAFALLALPVSAQAATVTYEPDGTLLVVADAGKSSYILVEMLDAQTPGDHEVYLASVNAYGKQGELFQIPPQCTNYTASGSAVTCPDTALTRVRVEAGDGSDDVRASNAFGTHLPLEVSGGLGKDRLTINRACVNCVADGGAGVDKVAMCPCGGIAYGGDGNDQISTRFPYMIPANGTLGTTIHGDAGNDRLEGSDNDDTIDGGLGNDRITGLKRFDTLLGGEGKDRIYAADGSLGNDTIDCGTNGDGSRELDFARIDANSVGTEDATTNCERVSRQMPH